MHFPNCAWHFQTAYLVCLWLEVSKVGSLMHIQCFNFDNYVLFEEKTCKVYTFLFLLANFLVFVYVILLIWLSIDDIDFLHPGFATERDFFLSRSILQNRYDENL